MLPIQFTINPNNENQNELKLSQIKHHLKNNKSAWNDIFHFKMKEHFGSLYNCIIKVTFVT